MPSSRLSRRSLILARSGLLAVLLCAAQQLSAEVVLVRDSVIEIEGLVVSANNYRLQIDGLDATAYTSLDGSTLKLLNPFPERRDVFQVSVFESNTQEPMYQGEYRVATQGDIFDSIDYQTSGQLDSTYIDERQPEPFEEDPDFPFDGNSSQSDLLGALDITAQRGRFSSQLGIEAVNRTDPDATLRYNGPQADISRFHLRNDLRTHGGSTVFMRAGDVDISSSNQLVNSGIASRGFTFGFNSPAERFRIEAGRVYGTDIVGTVRGPIAWSSDSYRTGVSADFDIIGNERISWSVNGSLVDVQRPVEDNFGVSESPVGETNTVTGWGTTIGVFNERLRLSLNWASSDYDNPLELNERNLPDDEDSALEGDDYDIYDPGTTSGRAYSYDLSWAVWSGELASRASSVDLELRSSRATPFYRSMHGGGTADRKEWSAAFNLAHGPVSGRVSTTQYRNNLDDLITIHTLDEALHEIALDFDLSALREGALYPTQDESQSESAEQETGGGNLFIPSSVGFAVTIEDLKTLNGDVIILAPVIEGLDFMDQTTETLSVNLGWQGIYNTTSLDLGYSFLDIDQLERASADQRDINYGISHDIRGENWSLGGRLGFNYTDDLDDASRSKTSVAEWGLTASFNARHGISYSLSFDNNRDRIKDYVFNERERSNSDRYNISMDFGEYLQRTLSLGTLPSVVASWQRTDTDSVSSYYDSTTSSSSLTVNVGLSF